LKRRYGDCKDKAALFIALLRAAGIPSYIALLNAGSRQDVPADLPGMGIFDHAIVYVPGSPGLWIDATDDHARLGQLDVLDQGRRALIAQPGTQSLVLTPIASAEESLLVEKREFFLQENGHARIVETSIPHGALESSYRGFYPDPANKDRKKELSDYMENEYLADRLDRFEPSDATAAFHFSRWSHDAAYDLIFCNRRAKRPHWVSGFLAPFEKCDGAPLASIYLSPDSPFTAHQSPISSHLSRRPVIECSRLKRRFWGELP
jgi:hypothetical protein